MSRVIANIGMVPGGRYTRALLALIPLFAALSQSPAPPAFDVASLKPTQASRPGGSMTIAGKADLTMLNMPLHRMMERAYGVRDFELVAPDWTNNQNFDIFAKFPAGTSSAQQMLMLRTLLAERFHLAVHTEKRELPGYALLVAKSGFRLTPVEPSHSQVNTKPGRRLTEIDAKASTIAVFADALARVIGQTVADETGVSGVYDIELKYMPDDAPQPGDAVDPPAPSLFAAIQEQLGMRLQARKIPTGVIVVDRVDRTPSEN